MVCRVWWPGAARRCVSPKSTTSPSLSFKLTSLFFQVRVFEFLLLKLRQRKEAESGKMAAADGEGAHVLSHALAYWFLYASPGWKIGEHASSGQKIGENASAGQIGEYASSNQLGKFTSRLQVKSAGHKSGTR